MPATIDPSTCHARPGCAISAGCAPLGSASCSALGACHAAKLQICDVLETIADSLPGAVNCNACLWVAASLLPCVREAQNFEETVVFPAFAKTVDAQESIRRLRAEHVEDEALAEELTEMLLSIGHGGEVRNPEALGFMLRAFFEAMRRHVAFEREHVMPLVQG